MIGALDAPTEGSIVIDGKQVSGAGRRDLFRFRRETVSFVFQTFNLFPGLTALENVRFGVDVAGHHEGNARAAAVLERVGLGERFDYLPSQLSGGEQQRVAIARALATGNPVLLADEPTGELDFTTGVQILELLHEQVVPTQVDASHDGGPDVGRIYAEEGRTLRAGDGGDAVAVLDAHFADAHGLPPRGTIQVSGGTTPLRYVGHGLSPEYFFLLGNRGVFTPASSYAVTFAPLDTAQRITGRPGSVNDVVLTVRLGSDLSAIRREVRAALEGAFPDVGFTLNGKASDPGYRYLYDDIEGDQRFYDIFAVLILLGAAFAAFNLTGRIVEAQRREIGIGMALGVRPPRLAVRPSSSRSESRCSGCCSASVSGWWSAGSWGQSPSRSSRCRTGSSPSSPVCSPAVPRSGSRSRSSPRCTRCGGRCGLRPSRRSAPASSPPRGPGWRGSFATSRCRDAPLLRCPSATARELPAGRS